MRSHARSVWARRKPVVGFVSSHACGGVYGMVRTVRPWVALGWLARNSMPGPPPSAARHAASDRPGVPQSGARSRRHANHDCGRWSAGTGMAGGATNRPARAQRLAADAAPLGPHDPDLPSHRHVAHDLLTTGVVSTTR